MTGDRYKMRTVARLTGLSPAVLRAWERRYGLLKPVRGPGGHRLYTEDDLRVLQNIKVLLDEGRSIGEAAEQGREVLLTQTRLPAEPQNTRIDEKKPELPRDNAQQQLIDAALALDGNLLTQALDQVFASFSPEHAIYDVLFPAATEIGELWARGRCSVACEHLISNHLTLRLRKLLEIAQVTHPRSRQVICACFPDEQHELGMLALAYQLSCHGLPVTYLGPCLPFEDLDFACRRLQPTSILLSVTRAPLFLTHRHGLRLLLERQQGRYATHLGGGGAPEIDAELEALGLKLWGNSHKLDELFECLGLRSGVQEAEDLGE